jgi:hypothetical protein
MKLIDIVYESVLLEYNEKLIKQLIDKFDVDSDMAREYIMMFKNYSPGLDVTKRDITKYSWDELKSLVDQKKNNPKRIKAGKIGDDHVDKDDVIYDRDNVKIYRGDSKEKCIRYGNGYNFCISSRGSNNQFDYYRKTNRFKGESVTFPYFVFNKNLSLDDPSHLLVIMVDKIKNDSFYRIFDEDLYSVWDADNRGRKTFYSYSNLVSTYPWLYGLQNIFK